MVSPAFRSLIDHRGQLAIAGHVRQEVEGGIGAVSGDQLLPERRDMPTAVGGHGFPHPRSLDWIISARGMLLRQPFPYWVGEESVIQGSNHWLRRRLTRDAACFHGLRTV
jgi:hypothetical protein